MSTNAGIPSMEQAATQAATSAPVSFPVRCEPLGRSIDVREGETILDGALRNGLALPHSCRNGVCGTCKAKLVEGSVDYGPRPTAGLSDEEKAQGFALMCQSKPLTPVTVECTVIEAAAGFPLRKLATRVQQLERLAPDVMRLRLKLPQNQQLAFLPGQYISVILPGNIKRSLSLANPPHENEALELHLRNYGGPFSQHVFGKLKETDLLRVEGPQGTFFVRSESDKPIVFVASGTGFAPIKAMVEHQLRQGIRRPMSLYWGARRPVDLYLNPLVEGWVKEHGLRYIPVVSDATAEDAWTGRTGFVHRAVMEDFPDLSGHQVYACGAPIVVDSARKDLTAHCQLPAADFFADMFVSGAAPAA
jgi:CDP-4-dehydro-6-deoxyglucose reductase